MKITKREAIFSLVIICVMLIFGTVVADKNSEYAMSECQKYNTALQIDNDSDLFEYGIRTNVGNSFAYGNLSAVGSVTFPDIGGEYASVTKMTQRYTRHIRTVTKTRTVNGQEQSYTDTEVYWSWDTIDLENKNVETISFLEQDFPFGTINGFEELYIDTVYKSLRRREVYYGSALSYPGTLYATLTDGAVSNPVFYHDKNIEETIEYLSPDWSSTEFWILWAVLTILVVIGFCFFENRWLE